MSVATEVDLRALAEGGAAELGPDAAAERGRAAEFALQGLIAFVAGGYLAPPLLLRRRPLWTPAA